MNKITANKNVAIEATRNIKLDKSSKISFQDVIIDNDPICIMTADTHCKGCLMCEAL